MANFFTINVGSNGSIIILNSKSEILQYLFVENLQTEENKQKVQKLFKQYSKLPIYIILDNLGQSYNIRYFPNVNIFDLNKIVKRKFHFDIPEEDLKEKRFINYDKINKKWKYMFISSPIDGLLEEWINFISDIDNILNGIYMLPLETEKILKQLKIKLKLRQSKKVEYWDILLVENKISGFREVTSINGKLVFTRILNEDLSDQEHFDLQFKENILRTVEYLKRFHNSFNANNLNIYTITSDRVRDLIKNFNVANSNFKIKKFSCAEFANIFNLNNKIDKYLDTADVLLEELIMFNKKIISFSTKEMKQLYFISRIHGIISKSLIILFVILFLIVSIGIVNIIINKFKINNANHNYSKTSKSLEIKKKQKFGEGIDSVDDIIDESSFYIETEKAYKDPFDLFKKTSQVTDNSIVSNSIHWKMEKYSNKPFIGYKESVSFSSVIVNRSGKIDDLFKIYENIDSNIKNNFINHDINISKLPKSINFNTEYFSFPIKIDINEK